MVSEREAPVVRHRGRYYANFDRCPRRYRVECRAFPRNQGTKKVNLLQYQYGTVTLGFAEENGFRWRRQGSQVLGFGIRQRRRRRKVTRPSFHYGRCTHAVFSYSKMTLTCRKTLKMDESVSSIQLSPDQRLLAVALLDSTVKIMFSDTLKVSYSVRRASGCRIILYGC